MDQLEQAPENGLGGIHTPYWDSTGNPAMSIPMGFGLDGMPLGLQIAGRAFDEITVLQTADAFQQRTDWHLRKPQLVSKS
jgi:aspartyl-tRNA(Asn)/glutamyl-tRNA(Gln) amidotransferase subunit A